MLDKQSDYTRLQRSPARVAAIIGAVVVFHVCLILALGNWFGHKSGSALPGLIRVAIFPDTPPPASSARPDAAALHRP
jgi:hypothetical protein